MAASLLCTWKWLTGRRLVIALPYAWLVVLFVLPFLILLRISITDMGNGIDPFAPLASSVAGEWQVVLKWDNYRSIFIGQEPGAGWLCTVYLQAYLTSLKYAFLTTVLCLAISYPFAYFLARARPLVRPGLLLLVVLPFWTSFYCGSMRGKTFWLTRAY